MFTCPALAAGSYNALAPPDATKLNARTLRADIRVECGSDAFTSEPPSASLWQREGGKASHCLLILYRCTPSASPWQREEHLPYGSPLFTGFRVKASLVASPIICGSFSLGGGRAGPTEKNLSGGGGVGGERGPGQKPDLQLNLSRCCP